MSSVTMPPSSPPALGGRLVGLLVLAVIALGALAGSSFSTHVGMSASASQLSDRRQDQVHVSAPASTVSEPASETTVVEAPVLTSPETQHLMHVLGACLALLVVALVLAPVLRRLDVLGRGRSPVRRPARLATSRLARHLTVPDPLTASAVLLI